MGDSKKLFEYFAIVGLKDDAEDLIPSAPECGCRNSAPLAPITDICVIFPGLGETVHLFFLEEERILVAILFSMFNAL